MEDANKARQRAARVVWDERRLRPRRRWRPLRRCQQTASFQRGARVGCVWQAAACVPYVGEVAQRGCAVRKSCEHLSQVGVHAGGFFGEEGAVE
eukprot:6007209-Pleurochrysis_carterae.AAC.1